MKCAWSKCGAEIAPRTHGGGCAKRYCCRDHKTAARVERGILETASRLAGSEARECKACGKPFRSLQPAQRFCSTRCRERFRERPIEQRRAIGRRYSARAWQVPEKRLASLLRNRIFNALAGRKGRPGSAVRDLGCTMVELKAHLESQFMPGMTWKNWGPTGWHVDHVRPLASFDLTNRAQFLAACHFTNLRPLWWFANVSKGSLHQGVRHRYARAELANGPVPPAPVPPASLVTPEGDPA